MKNLLLLSYFFPPHGGGGGLRAVETVRLLEPLGWRSTVVAGPESGYWHTDESLLERIPPSAEVLRTGVFNPARIFDAFSRKGREPGKVRSEGAIRRLRKLADWLPVPDVYFGWIKPAVSAARAKVGEVDWIMSTSPPETAHLAAMYLSRRYGKKWAADFRDPWVSGIYRRFPTPVHESFQRKLERAVIRRADLVLASSREAVEDFRGRYPGQPPDKFQFLPNGFDSAEFAALKKDALSAGPLRIIHAGNLTLGRDISALLEALAALKNEKPCGPAPFQLELAGPCDSRLKVQAEKLGLAEEVVFSGYLPRGEILKRLAGSHLALLVESFDPRAALVVPGKLYDYFGAGLPVLALAPEGAVSQVLERTRAGVMLTSPDRALVKETLQKFLGRFRAGKPLLGPPDQAELARYERASLVGRLAELLEERG